MALGGFGLDPQPQGHGSIVGERDLHVSAETAARDRCVQGLGALQQIVEQAFTLGRRCGRGKARTHALLGIGRKGELRDQEQTTADIGQAQIRSLPSDFLYLYEDSEPLFNKRHDNGGVSPLQRVGQPKGV